jgi:hypothetical protein
MEKVSQLSGLGLWLHALFNVVREIQYQRQREVVGVEIVIDIYVYPKLVAVSNNLLSVRPESFRVI